MTTIKLEDPITVDGKEVAELTVRKPKVRDVRLARKTSATDADVEHALFANLTGLTPDQLDDMSLGDYARVQGVVADFLPPEVLATMQRFAATS